MAELQPFPPPSSTWWALAYYTPVSDAVRGNLSGRLDVRRTLAAANLPAPVAAKIYELVRGTRLSRQARVALAADLIARGTSQLAAGHEVAALIAELDEPGLVARGTRRVKAAQHRSLRWAATNEILAADLPEAIERLLETVVKQTRLWPREKRDVARELVAHFADGLASGRTSEQMINDFGQPRQAAQLIRQAKLRNRSRAWQVYRLAARTLLFTLAIGIVAYALWSVRFFLGQPRIEHNYWTQMNSGRRGPAAERAWPLYRAALIKLGKDDFEWTEKGNPWEEPPDWPAWDAFLARHQPSLELIRQAAARERLGYLLGDADDRAEIEAAAAQWLMPAIGPTEAENQELIGALLGGIQALRKVALLLKLDALRAARSGDGATAETDLNSLLALSEQLLDSRGFLVEYLVGYAFFHAALDATGEILRDHPTAFTDQQLHALAHRLAGYHGGVIDVDFEAEKVAFDDLLQRVFTDDGQGDGRITSAGANLLNNSGFYQGVLWNGGQDATLHALAQFGVPGIAAFVGSRKENHDLYKELLAATIAQHQGPPWTWDAEAIRQTNDRIAHMGPRDRIRYILVNLMLPSVPGVYHAVEYAIQRRDATEVALALELWRRRHGDWPASLDQLVPELLPAVPPDRADGKPLRYALRDGKPVLYSLGVDRDDDGGRSAGGTQLGRIVTFGPVDDEQLQRFRTSPDDNGDWILWPHAAVVQQPFYLQRDEGQANPEASDFDSSDF